MSPGFYELVVAFAQKYDVIVASDLAYSEMYYEAPPRSFLETPGAREVGIEFHSLSKTYNMTGWRVGWACGNPQLVAGLGQVKTNVDSGVFEAVQRAAIAACCTASNTPESTLVFTCPSPATSLALPHAQPTRQPVML